MLKKFLSVIIIGCLVLSLIGCSSKNNGNSNDSSKSGNSSKTNGINFDEDPYTINVVYPVYGVTPTDLAKVQDKVNEITLKEINAKINFKPVSVTSMANVYTLAAASNDNYDLIMIIPASQFFVQYIQSNMIIPIDDLVKQYGSDMTASLGDIMKVGQYNGKQYAIPIKESSVLGRGISLNGDIVKKYNIDISKVKTLADLDPIFEMLHKKDPSLALFWPYSVSYNTINYDSLGNSLGVLENGGLDNLTVKNIYDLPEYRTLLLKMREWYQKGYIPKDYATSQDQPTALQNAGKVFAITNTISFDHKALAETPPKYDILINVPNLTTDQNQTFLWTVPTIAKRPDKAVQFMNLLFKNPKLASLLKYGIKDVHYTENADGILDTTKGFNTFRQNWPIWGDATKYPRTKVELGGTAEGNVDKYNELQKSWAKTVTTSKAYGFIFNPEPVKNEIAACQSVMTQYAVLLEGGAVDPDEYIKIVDSQLNDAGLQKIIAEKQRQLDEWAKANNVK